LDTYVLLRDIQRPPNEVPFARRHFGDLLKNLVVHGFVKAWHAQESGRSHIHEFTGNREDALTINDECTDGKG